MKLNEWLKGKFSYDPDGQYIWLVKANEHMQMIAELRGWGAIQNLFKRKDQSIDIQAAGLFQDELGKWVVDALNEKLEAGLIMYDYPRVLSKIKALSSEKMNKLVDFLNTLENSEASKEPETSIEPVLIGHLNREYSYNHYLPAPAGTEVYEFEGKYFFTITPADSLVQVTQQIFYKETLKDHITFLK